MRGEKKMMIKPIGASLPAFTLRAAHTLMITLAVVDYVTRLSPIKMHLLSFPLAIIYALAATKTIDMLLRFTTLSLTSLSTAASTAFATAVTTTVAWGQVPAYMAIPGCFASTVGLCLQVHPSVWLPLHATTLVLTTFACVLEQWELVLLLAVIAWIVLIVEVATSFSKRELLHEWYTTVNGLWPILAWTMPLLADSPWIATTVAGVGGLAAYKINRRAVNTLATHYAVAELLGQKAGPLPMETANHQPAIANKCLITVAVQVVLTWGVHWLTTRVPWPETALTAMTAVALLLIAYMLMSTGSVTQQLVCVPVAAALYITSPAYVVTMACASIALVEKDETLYLHIDTSEQ